MKKSKQGTLMGMEGERERGQTNSCNLRQLGRFIRMLGPQLCQLDQGTSTWKFVDDIAWRLSDVTCGLSPGGVAMGCYSSLWCRFDPGYIGYIHVK